MLCISIELTDSTFNKEREKKSKSGSKLFVSHGVLEQSSKSKLHFSFIVWKTVRPSPLSLSCSRRRATSVLPQQPEDFIVYESYSFMLLFFARRASRA